MFRGFVNIWNYFSENVTALRMRDNCWGVTQRRSALPLATNGTQERGDGLARQDAQQYRDNAAAATRSVRGAWRVSKKHEVKDQRMGEVCEQGKYRKYEKRRKKSAGNVIIVVSLQPVPWYIKNNPPTLIVAGIRKLGYVL